MNESAFQLMVEQACTWNGLVYYHTFDSRRSNPGFPDLVIVGGTGVIYRELKTATGRISPLQKFWIDALRAAGEDADVWRPADFPDRVLAELKALGRCPVQKPVKIPKKLRNTRA